MVVISTHGVLGVSEKSLLLFFATILGALGITAPIDAVLGGLFLAVAASYLAMIYMPERTRKEVYASVFSALLLGWLVANLHEEIFPHVSLQPKMAAAGFTGRWIVGIAITFLNTLQTRAQNLSEKIIDKYSGDLLDQEKTDE